MTAKTAKSVENKKNWVAPELKKIGIEVLTATFHGGAQHDSSSNHS
jgi:hypothetical protein